MILTEKGKGNFSAKLTCETLPPKTPVGIKNVFFFFSQYRAGWKTHGPNKKIVSRGKKKFFGGGPGNGFYPENIFHGKPKIPRRGAKRKKKGWGGGKPNWDHFFPQRRFCQNLKKNRDNPGPKSWKLGPRVIWGFSPGKKKEKKKKGGLPFLLKRRKKGTRGPKNLGKKNALERFLGPILKNFCFFFPPTRSGKNQKNGAKKPPAYKSY